MPNELRSAMFACLAVIAFMVLIPPAMLGGREDALGKFVYDYQTLITGVAAVGAAFATVRKMTETEISQGKRHQQSVDLAQRADRIALERAINPQLQDLAAVQPKLQSLDLSKDRFANEPGDPDYRLVSSVCEEYLSAVNELNEIFERKAFVDGRKLFDGRLTRELDLVEVSLGYLTKSLNSHQNVDWDRDANAAHYYEEAFDEFGWYLINEMQKLPPRIITIVTKLGEIEHRYFQR